jgi:hypothetical protein
VNKTLFSSVLFLMSITSFSQVWKPVKNKLQADYLIYETNIKSEADIIGLKVKSELDCTRPGCIYLAPIWHSKGRKVFFVSDPNEADLKIYWTTNKEETKWKITN